MSIALTIAGSDSGGGAGIQADLKTFSALGVYGASVITALTAQNTLGVTAVHEAPLDVIAAQLDAVLSDFEVGAAKTAERRPSPLTAMRPGVQTAAGAAARTASVTPSAYFLKFSLKSRASSRALRS